MLTISCRWSVWGVCLHVRHLDLHADRATSTSLSLRSPHRPSAYQPRFKRHRARRRAELRSVVEVVQHEGGLWALTRALGRVGVTQTDSCMLAPCRVISTGAADPAGSRALGREVLDGQHLPRSIIPNSRPAVTRIHLLSHQAEAKGSSRVRPGGGRSRGKRDGARTLIQVPARVTP